jgi:Tfp pilus assembly protein PilF
MKYRDFRLQIVAKGSEGYAVHAAAPGRLGEGQAPFIPPFTPRDAGALAAALRRAGNRNFNEEEIEGPEWSPEQIGERLSTALFQGEILRLYERCVDRIEDDAESGLRLELILDPREQSLAALQDLPWELLRQPGRPEFLALSRRRPLVRYLAVPLPVLAAPRPRPLRILAIAASPRGLPALDLSRERRNLDSSVGKAKEIEIVDAVPTLAGLREALIAQECHALHFMGHGGSVPGRAERVLFFEAPDGSSHPVSGTDLLNKLADFQAVRLVVLNACESAAGSEIDPFRGIASSLVLGGLPAVVAMRLPISDVAAIAFSRAFYQRLAVGDPVDAAVAEGRQAVHSEKLPGAEWSTPVLFMRTPNGELYPEREIPAEGVRWKRLARWAAAAVLLLALGARGWLGFRDWKVERLLTEGVAFSEHNQWDKAHDRFVAASKLAPRSAEVLSNLAGSQEKLGFLDAAEKNYRKAANLRPDMAEHLYNLGHFLNGQGSYWEAHGYLKSAVKRDPGRVDAYGELASAALHLGLLDDARQALATALRLDPKRPALYRRLGELALKADRPAEAVSPLNQARSREKLGERGRTETASLLVQAYDKLGNRDSTCDAVDEFRLLDPQALTPWALPVTEAAERRGCAPER